MLVKSTIVISKLDLELGILDKELQRYDGAGAKPHLPCNEVDSLRQMIFEYSKCGNDRGRRRVDKQVPFCGNSRTPPTG